MSRKFHISECAVQTHKCCLCRYLLSVPPIMTAGLEAELYKCGRCDKVKCQTYTRNRLYEDVAQHLAFPCSYAQCDKRAPWGRVEEHERECRHRTIKCPIYYHNCYEVLRVDKLKEHFEEKHGTNMKVVGETWSLNVGYDYVFLVQVDDQYVFVYVMHLNENFSVAVLPLGPIRYSKFNVKLLPPTEDKFAVTFEDIAMVRYDERSHCYMCIRKKCHEPHHPCSEKNKSEQIKLGNFAKQLKKELINTVKSSNGDISYCITFIEDEDVSTNQAQEAEETSDITQEEAVSLQVIPPQMNVESLRNALRCPYCMEYMAAPIFVCATGHTLCNVCRPRLDKCPTCAAQLGNARNYTLEEMAKDIGVPCQYDVKGCTFVCNAAKMYFHEQECSFNNVLRE